MEMKLRKLFDFDIERGTFYLVGVNARVALKKVRVRI